MKTPQISVDDIRLVQQTWEQVIPISDLAATLFYDRLFETDPDLRALFDGTDLDAQKRKLLDALSLLITGLDDFDALVPVLAALGQRHIGYGATPAHYFAVGAALLHTLETGLGDSWTEDAAGAWTAVYTAVADIMKSPDQTSLAA